MPKSIAVIPVLAALAATGCAARGHDAPSVPAPAGEPPVTAQVPQPVAGTEPETGPAAAQAAQAAPEPPATYTVHFAPGSAELDAVQRDLLARHAEYLVAHPRAMLAVTGHADPRGSAAANLELSRRRAEAVAAVLREHGVEAGRLIVDGLGEAAAGEAGPGQWAQQRRVDLEYLDDYRLGRR